MSKPKTSGVVSPVSPANAGDLFDRHLEEHTTIAAETRVAARDTALSMLDVWLTSLRRGRMILLFGNGGSASTAQHIAAELVVRLHTNRQPISAIALTADSSVITASGNDLGFQNIFSRQIEAIGRPGDVAVAFTTSGESGNILAALDAAREFGVIPAAFCGANCPEIVSRASPAIAVPSSDPTHIQELHLVIGHFLCHAAEKALGLS